MGPSPTVSLRAVEKTADNKIADIQILRGVSIVLTILCHLSLVGVIWGAFPVKASMPFWMGVPVFFVISGYVIARALMKDGCDAVHFVVRRILRLLPTMLLLLATACLLNALCREISFSSMCETRGFCGPWPHFLRHCLGAMLGYGAMFLSPPIPFATSVTWSLNIEDQFYGAMALVCGLLGYLFRRRSRAIEVFIFWLSALILASVTAARGYVLFSSDTWGRVPRALSYLGQCQFDFMAAGVLLAFFDRRYSDKVRGTFRESGPFLSAILIIMPLIVVAMCEPPLGPAPRLLHGFALPFSLACISALVLLAANGLAIPVGGGRFRRLMVYLGDRSYTLYLFHPPALIVAFLVVWKWAHWAIFSAVWFGIMEVAVTLAVVLPVCHLIYQFVELPCIRLGKRLTVAAGRAPTTSVSRTAESAPVEPEVPRKRAA